MKPNNNNNNFYFKNGKVRGQDVKYGISATIQQKKNK